ncbi:MAG: hypothetical protein ABR549_07370, partial [Mycobacteriales bacterium]
MPLTHVTPIFSVDQAGIYPLLTDTGANPTYGARLDLPGVHDVALNPDTLYKELFGDNAIIANASKLRKMGCAATWAKASLDVLVQLAGGTVTDAGVTPNQTSTYSVKNTDAGKYFKFEFRVLGVEVPASAGGGDAHAVLWKCKAADWALPT